MANLSNETSTSNSMDKFRQDSESSDSFCIVVKWSGQEIIVSHLAANATVSELKSFLCETTSVLPHRQKLLGGVLVYKLIFKMVYTQLFYQRLFHRMTEKSPPFSSLTKRS